MLSALDADHMLHPILAGCLAIDSCLSSIVQTELLSHTQIQKNIKECLYSFSIMEESLSKVEHKNFKNDFYIFARLFKQLVEAVEKGNFGATS